MSLSSAQSNRVPSVPDLDTVVARNFFGGCGLQKGVEVFPLRGLASVLNRGVEGEVEWVSPSRAEETWEAIQADSLILHSLLLPPPSSQSTTFPKCSYRSHPIHRRHQGLFAHLCVRAGQAHAPRPPYDYGALEPAISSKIMELHHTKHHQTYVNGLNQAEEQLPEAIHKRMSKSAIASRRHQLQRRWTHQPHALLENLAPQKNAVES